MVNTKRLEIIQLSRELLIGYIAKDPAVEKKLSIAPIHHQFTPALLEALELSILKKLANPNIDFHYGRQS